jgi:hypothetical protein
VQKPAGRGAVATLLAIIALKIAAHIYGLTHYGYFTDELYYLACGRHLDWGYVDQPPLIALIVRLVQATIGQSLFAIRLLPLFAGIGEIVLVWAIARELGGNPFARALAAIATLAAPGVLAADGIMTMNAFEPLFWMGCAYIAVRMIKTGNKKLWVWFGVISGFGLENKYSMLIFGAGLVAGLLLSSERRLLVSPWLLAGGAIAFAIFLPNLIWNLQHHFPFLELQANIRASGRDVSLGPTAFFTQETLLMNPLILPVWLGGLWFFFLTSAGKQFRALGWAWIFTAVVVVTMSPRVYYLFPAFPLLFAGGAVLWERLFAGPRLAWLKFAYPALILLTGAILAPLAIPELSPEAYIRYTKALGFGQPRIENHRLGPLPQIFADQFGWENMAATVAGFYNTLPLDVRSRTAIFGQNYGQAGAIDLFGPKYGLPPAISGHQSYFLWGPRGYTGDSMIVLDDNIGTLTKLFSSVQKVARVEHPYSMPYQQFDVFYCRGPFHPLAEFWPRVKSWD